MFFRNHLTFRFKLSLKKLGMRSQTHKIYRIAAAVKPYQKEITLYMTLHIIGIISRKHMRTILLRNRYLFLKHLQNGEKLP